MGKERKGGMHGRDGRKEVKEREPSGRKGNRAEGKGREGKGREEKGREGKRREGKEKEEKEREGMKTKKGSRKLPWKEKWKMKKAGRQFRKVLSLYKTYQ